MGCKFQDYQNLSQLQDVAKRNQCAMGSLLQALSCTLRTREEYKQVGSDQGVS